MLFSIDVWHDGTFAQHPRGLDHSGDLAEKALNKLPRYLATGSDSGCLQNTREQRSSDRQASWDAFLELRLAAKAR